MGDLSIIATISALTGIIFMLLVSKDRIKTADYESRLKIYCGTYEHSETLCEGIQ